jgi:hypothetical protein
MDNIQAEESIRTIREIMERSAKYTNFSGLSGIVSGLLAIAGCIVSLRVAGSDRWGNEPLTYVLIWSFVFLAALSQDAFLANRKAKRNGDKLLNPASIMVIKAVTPGILLALTLCVRGVLLKDWNHIPVYWTLCYGVAASAAGLFSVPEVRIFGWVQLITGAIALFLVSTWASAMLLIALSFGLYQILFGLWLSHRYGW